MPTTLKMQSQIERITMTRPFKSEVVEVADKIIGMTESDAITYISKNNCKHRIIYKDGKSFAITLDCSFNRVNLEIQDGIVIKASVG